MSDSRRRSHDTSDDEVDHTSRNVRPRRSIFSDDPYLEHTNRINEPSDESDSNEEPFEDEEEPLPARSESPPTVPPTVFSSPIVPSSPIPFPSIPTTTFTTYRPVNPLRWDWMPDVLKWWRRAEKIPMLPEVPGPRTPIPPLTQEPVHHTIPVLITRLLTHDHQLEQLEQAANDRMDLPTSEVELLQHQVSGVESELSELSDTVVTTHTVGIQTRDEVAVLRQQLEESQHRITELEQEMVAVRADRDQLRTVTASSARMVALLEGMIERLDSPI